MQLARPTRRAVLASALLAGSVAACDDAAPDRDADDVAILDTDVVEAADTADADGSGAGDSAIDSAIDSTDEPAVDVAGDSAEVDAADAAPDTGPIATEFTLVELASDAPPPLRLAVRACAGLHNRALGGSVYVQHDTHDQRWLDELDLEPSVVVGAQAFVESCLDAFPTCVRYSFDEQQALLPSIITAAAAIGAVPLDEGSGLTCADPVFDAIAEFEERNTPELAARFVMDNYVDQTTGLAMLNPGYDTNDSNLSNPALNGQPVTSMVDLVFSERLFVVFLINGCTAGHPENATLQAIVDQAGWPTPLGVYGYNNSWHVGGYLHEAQTRCLSSRNMGAIPTETGNLSFFSTRRAPITGPDELQRNAPDDVAYDPSKTYVAFVIGDGDNIRFMMSSRSEWLRQRLADCELADNSCAPVSWSISPHLARLAPDVLEWFFASTARTGHDYFTLPPSGHLYAYPSSLNEQDQDGFVAATERDARILGVRGVVHWEWFDSWRNAQNHFLPKYATSDGVIRGLFPVNVPYLLDAFPWWGADEFFRVLTGEDGSEVVVFRPREWRGISGTDSPNQADFFVSPQQMADELSAHPPGTVTWVYMTSDGGLNLENSFMALVELLPDHVQLVSADTAAALALAAGRD